MFINSVINYTMKRITLLLILALFSCTKDPVMYDVTVSATEGGTVSPQSGSFEEGSSVTITATPSAEYDFTKWSNGSTQNPLVLTVTSDLTIQATFTKKQYELNISKEGEGTVSEKVINTGKGYDSGTKVELTAVPAGEWVFAGWSGDVTSNDNPLQVTISSPKNIKAKFVKRKYPLTINIEGQGTVTEEIVNTGRTTEYDSGTTVRLTAQPSEGWEFSGWSGDIESTSLAIELDVSQAISVKAKFMRYFNYKVPSHDWENYYQEWFDLARITDSLGFSKNDSYNTNAAYADFNFDGYLDIMIQPNVSDGLPVDSFFLINNGNDKFYIDENFPLIQNVDVISSRKTIVGDFNNDGKPDVVRPQGGHDWLGKPQITISRENGYEIKLIGNGPEIQPHTISSGDIDNDGDLDLFFAQGGEQDGFLINNGDAIFEWKWISEIITDFDKGFVYPDGGYGYYGFGSSEMTDVDKDGFVDLILGGGYRDNSYDAAFDGPTILWGTGTGKYSINSRTTLFKKKELSYDGGRLFSLSHDYAVNDVNGDGINDIVVLSELSGPKLIHFILGKGNREFEDKSADWLNDNLLINISNLVWINLRDVDGDGNLDIVEGEPVISVQEQFSASGWRDSVRWEWNGNGFTKIN